MPYVVAELDKFLIFLKKKINLDLKTWVLHALLSFVL